MTGAEIKELIKSAGVKCWQVAERLGMQDSNFSRRLRKPFNDSEVEHIQAIVAELSTNPEPTNTNKIKEAV